MEEASRGNALDTIDLVANWYVYKAIQDRLVCMLIPYPLAVVAKLGDAYDTHYGVRSVIHEVRRIAVQLVADAQIQGTLKSGWLAHLCVNDEGDIDLVAMDSKGSLVCLV